MGAPEGSRIDVPDTLQCVFASATPERKANARSSTVTYTRDRGRQNMVSGKRAEVNQPTAEADVGSVSATLSPIGMGVTLDCSDAESAEAGVSRAISMYSKLEQKAS